MAPQAIRVGAGLAAAGKANALGGISAADIRDEAGDQRRGRNRLLLEHLPTVRYLARRIHERLPQHVEMEDLCRRGSRWD